ncbi:hypothetical protein QYE76_057930 [Lolium multiflorum]|uniref:F-box domain-containing protein n=1 Tax=Lolium multiflorum TaxID=4521 RepID=A0AAD8T5U5_LOLMU|nr:hypothetical protein QYE76_057930 [Lolium multiflorum]
MTTSLPEELHLEILKRLLPSPQVLARASAVCKEWHRVVNDPVFLHELYRARRGAPVTLGFFHNFDDLARRFVHVDEAGPARFTFDYVDHKMRKWKFLDCCHGRVLLHDELWYRFLVWQPMTGDHHLVSNAGSFNRRHSGAALICECARDGGGDDRCTPCNSSHFRLAVVSNDMVTDCLHASVFSSVTGKWTASAAELPPTNQIRPEPCVIVGKTLYQPLFDYLVLAFDTDHRTLTTFERPNFGHVRLFKSEDGVLGLAGVLGFMLSVWVRDADTWVTRKTVDLSQILPIQAMQSQNRNPWFTFMPVKIIGVADGGHDLFLLTEVGIFLFCVDSMELKKVHQATHNMKTVYPYGAFYRPPTARTST